MPRTTILTVLALLLLAVPARAQDAYSDRPTGEVYRVDASGPVRIGFGEVGIVPDWPVRLSYGAGTPTRAAYDTPTIKALVLEVDTVQTVLVEVDVIGIFRGLAERMKAAVAEATGVPAERIMLAATHNHSYPSAHRDRVSVFLTEKTVEAVRRALDTRFDARIGFGATAAAEDLNLNRAELHGRTNPMLYVLRVEDVDGNLRGVMYNYGTHPTIFTRWGANQGHMGPEWPGLVNHYVRMRTELDLRFERYDTYADIDPVPFVMFSEGAAGDQQPRRSDVDLDGETMPPKKVFVERLAREVLALLNEVETRREVELSYASQVIALPRRRGGERWTLVQALTVDSTALVAIPGELAVDLGYMLSEASPYARTIPITNANDYVGYIVPEHLAHERVTYQANGSPYVPHYGVQITDAAASLLDPDHEPPPELDAGALLGGLSGRVHYDGEHVAAVGVKRFPTWPNYGGGFWGKRTVVGEDGTWRIDGLAPGIFYIYVVEADPEQPGPERMKSGYSDLRLLTYGRPAVVEAGEETRHVDFAFPEGYGATDVEALQMDAGSLALDGRALSGRLDVEGDVAPGETIRVGLYPAELTYRRVEVFLQRPVVSTTAGPDGAFRFESIPPGRYRVGAVLDVNDNGWPEKRVDRLVEPQHSPVVEVDESGGVVIL